jgi:TonB family protein
MKSRRRVNSDVMWLQLTMRILLLFIAIVTFGGAANAQPTPTPAAPIPARRVQPPYPALAAAHHISGPVLVDVDIDPKGTVTEAVAITGDKMLRDVALKAARQWQFNAVDAAAIRTLRLIFIFHETSYVPPDKEPKFKCPYVMELIRVAMP